MGVVWLALTGLLVVGAGVVVYTAAVLNRRVDELARTTSAWREVLRSVPTNPTVVEHSDHTIGPGPDGNRTR